MAKNKRLRKKRHICLFTYASTWGRYLELTRGMGVEEFSMALRRFASHRGLPATIIIIWKCKTFEVCTEKVIKISQSAKSFALPYIQLDQLNFHSSKDSLEGQILEETDSKCKEALKKVNWSIYTHIWANTNFICRSGSNSQPSSSFNLCSWWHKSVEYPLSPSHLMYGRSSA